MLLCVVVLNFTRLWDLVKFALNATLQYTVGKMTVSAYLYSST